jgi:signal transduction histidine kinase
VEQSEGSVTRRPVYVLLREGAARERCLAELPGAEPVAVPLDVASLAGRTPGLLLVDLTGPDAGALVPALAGLPGRVGWKVGVVDVGGGDGGGIAVRTLSLGARHTLEQVRLGPDVAAGKGVLLELHGVLSDIARVRHDLNNPLTSALAEVQILLMDAPSGAEAESLLIIQEQLRRLRDRLVATKHLRPVEGHDEIAG